MNRWLIRGKLMTRSPLHIGSGEVVTRVGVQRVETDESGHTSRELVDVAAVATDHQGLPYIPGSGLKGCLRAWARSQDEELVNAIFGSQDKGGKVEFRDAHVVRPVKLTHCPPHWEANLLTGVGVSVAIDRRTRTASDRKLFHYELVPPGVSFDVVIAGRHLTDQEVPLLLAALDGFNDADDPATLGSGTGDGCGLLKWTREEVLRLDAAGLKKWLEGGAQVAGDLIVRDFGNRVDVPRASLVPSGKAVVRVEIEMRFDGSFLVNDPSQTVRPELPDPSAPKPPAHAPRRDSAGRPYLPAASFRGSFRSQAEKILRTLGGDRAACHDGLSNSCKAVGNGEEVKELCPTCKVFGATGWRAPFQVSDFTACADVTEATQDFLAIDRFTGGGANKLKFDALGAVRPVLIGTLSLDLKALERAGAGPWALGLLALTLRDLVEGDISFGFGAAKGYGTCRATIGRVSTPAWDLIPAPFQEGLTAELLPVTGTTALLQDSPLGEAVAYWVVGCEDLCEKRRLAGGG